MGASCIDRSNYAVPFPDRQPRASRSRRRRLTTLDGGLWFIDDARRVDRSQRIDPARSMRAIFTQSPRRAQRLQRRSAPTAPHPVLKDVRQSLLAVRRTRCADERVRLDDIPACSFTASSERGTGGAAGSALPGVLRRARCAGRAAPAIRSRSPGNSSSNSRRPLAPVASHPHRAAAFARFDDFAARQRRRSGRRATSRRS